MLKIAKRRPPRRNDGKHVLKKVDAWRQILRGKVADKTDVMNRIDKRENPSPFTDR